LRRGGRAAEGTGLENRRWETIQEFESLLLRHKQHKKAAKQLAAFFVSAIYARLYEDNLNAHKINKLD
jgi:O-acetylhomoserine/O-acetylserine sulfhydrylase-like pyridoxal-dependent enzyme